MARVKEFDPDVAVDAAMQLFWSQGYDATTPAQLVDHLGIGRGSLYNAFTSKRDLYGLALQRYVEHQSVRVTELLDGSGSVRERIRSVFDLVVRESVRDRDHRGCLVTNAAVELAGRDDEVRRTVRAVFDRQRAALTTAITQGQASGELAADVDAAALAAYLLATLNGIRVLARVDPSRARLTGLVDIALRTL